MIDLRTPAIQTPEWWLSRLLARLEARAITLRRWSAYYEGDQPMRFASEAWKENFRDRFPHFSSNFCALIVDGTRERMEVQGFRFRDQDGDKDLWEIWQANDLDGGSQLAHTEALVKGIAYALVEPNGQDFPTITVEDPLDCIVELAPKDRRKRLAGLKRWIDEDGRLVAYVYLPDAVYKYRTARPVDTNSTYTPDLAWITAQNFGKWQPADEEWPLPNPLNEVPLVPLPNRPRIKAPDGQSEIAPVMSNQDAINKYRADALVASEFVAYPQRWAIGVETETDDDTGEQKQPFKAAIDRLWVVPPGDPNDPNPPKVEFGQFAAASLQPYQDMIEGEIGQMSSISRMPYHYLLGQPQSVPPSGESLKSSEAGLVAKVRTARIHLGEGWEETMRLALRAMNDARADIRTAETIWRDPETRNEAVRTDAVIKQFSAGLISKEVALEALGYSPEQIQRMAMEPPAVEASTNGTMRLPVLAGGATNGQ
jgi:hypothetical protein